MNEKERGFSLVEGLLTLVVLILVAFVGWYVYQVKNKTIISYNNSIESSSSTISVPNNKSRPLTPKPDVTIMADNYSFMAPAGWAKTSPAPETGNTFQDQLGNSLHIEERGSPEGGGAYHQIVADSMWLVKDDYNNGITVVNKSPSCTPGQVTSFLGAGYTCDDETSVVRITLFKRAGGGEVFVNGHFYTIQFTGKNPDTVDENVISKMLSTFTVNKN